MARIEIQKSTSHTFEWSFYDHNIKEVPVSGTITITKPGGTSLVSETAVSIETDGSIRYTISAENTALVDCNYRIALTYQVGDTIKEPFYLFDVVETPILNQVRADDLFKYLPELRDKNTPHIVEASSGTTSEFTSSELNALGMEFKGGFVEIYTDSTTTHTAEVTTWEPALSRITFTPESSAAVAAGDKVRIRTSYQSDIDEAFDNIVSRDVRNRVGIKAGYIDSTVLRNLTVFKSLENICFAKVEEENDKWDLRAKKFEQMYKDEYLKLREPFDYNEDGQIDTDENKDRPSFLSRGIVR